MFAAPRTRPIPRVDRLCAFCTIRLGAIAETPEFYLGAWYHQGCVKAVRLVANSERRRRVSP